MGTPTGTPLLDFSVGDNVEDEAAEVVVDVGVDDPGLVEEKDDEGEEVEDEELKGDVPDELLAVVVDGDEVLAVLSGVLVIDGLIVVKIVAAARLNTCEGSVQLHPSYW
jgi:hypothetical protein